MRYYFFLHYGWFFQNLGKEAVRTFMHTTVCKLCWHVWDRPARLSRKVEETCLFFDVVVLLARPPTLALAHCIIGMSKDLKIWEGGSNVVGHNLPPSGWDWIIDLLKYGGHPCITGIRNPSIYNIIRWFAVTMGQTTRWPSIWCSKYYFFFIKSCKTLSIYFSIFL